MSRKDLDQSINEIYAAINLDEDELSEASIIWVSSKFKAILKKITRVKKDAIIENVSGQSELDKARLTLDGNLEVLGIFERAHKEIVARNTKEPFDPNAILPSEEE